MFRRVFVIKYDVINIISKMDEAKRQRLSANSQTQLRSTSPDSRVTESDSGEAQKGQTQYIIEMGKDYPFNHTCPDNCVKLVKYTRHFKPAEYPELRRQILACLQLRHPNLINIVKAFQSKKNSFFELYYEYVPENIEFVVGTLQKQEITETRNRLSDLFKYLIINNITPQVTTRNLGFKDKTIKFYLDIQKAESKNFTNKKQLVTIKEIQIRSLFTSLLRKCNLQLNKNMRPSAFVKSHQIMANSTTGSFLCFTDQEPRNSSLTNINKKAGQVDCQKNALDLNKIRFIDDKIKQLKLNMGKRPKPYRQSTTSQVALNDSALARTQQQPQKPQPPGNQMMKMVHQYMQAHHYGIRDGRDNNAQSPVLEIAVNRYDDQESIDTYNQELGEQPQLPKIVHQEMRQTTKSPPQLLFRQKLHQSVGNTRYNIIKQNAINNKDTLTLRQLDLSPNNRSRNNTSYGAQRDLVKSASSSGYLENKKYQSISEFKKSPEQSLKKSVAVSKSSSNSERKRIEDHLNEIKNIQLEISMRKINAKKADAKKSEKKVANPKTQQKDQKLGSLMKYYNFQPELLEEFNDILQSDTKPSRNQEKTESIHNQKRMEINQRVKLALKKSEATLQSFRHKAGGKFQMNVPSSQF